MHPALQFIAHYGYWIAVPIMILEGPFITIIMGFLSSFGLFNIFIVIGLGVISDLISDTILYRIGYHGGPWVLKKFKIREIQHNAKLTELRRQFNEHTGKIFFSAKVLTGVAQSTFVLAGLTKINYRKILKFSIPGGIVWSSGLAILGYYFGRHTTTVSKFLSRTGIILFSLVILVLLYKFWFGKYLARRYELWKEKFEFGQD